MKVPTYIGQWMAGLCLLLLLGGTLTACDAIYEDEGDCTTYYRVKFTYDMNMEFVDAFARNVRRVTLYLFNAEGRLVGTQAESGSVLAADGYVMNLEATPGTYTLVAWAEGWETGSTFTYPELQPQVHSLEDLTCRMNRAYDGTGGGAYVDNDLIPLFHGIKKDVVLDELLDGGERIIPMQLTKDTHTVRIILQHLSGEDVHVDDFNFSITDTNGLLNYDNSLREDELIEYRPWAAYEGTASLNTPADVSREAQTQVSVAVAELTVCRLMTDHKPVLTVRRKATGDTVLAIPLVDYALLVKGYYNREMDDQEYLDRQGEHNLTFFLDSNDRWINTSIIINSWRVVLQDVEI